MKYEPKKVFIKESGKYLEITYQEHQQRREKDKEYAKRKFIPMQGCIIETELTQYKEFYREVERIKYLKKLDIKFGLQSMDYLSSKMNVLQDKNVNVEEEVEEKMERENLYKAISLLPKDEQNLIKEHFFNGLSQVALSKMYGVNQSNISRKISKILQKIKQMIEN